MGKYIRKADRIDKERGDVLQLPKQFLEPLYSSDYPVDARRDILDALVGWFIGREIPKLKNPLANAHLQGFINQQKEAVQSYLDLCRVNANNRARQPNEDGATTVPQGRRPSTAVGNKIKVTVKDKRSESFTVTDATVTDGGIGRTADAPPSPPVTATATTKKEAMRQLYELAPPFDEKHYPKEDIAWWGDFNFQDANYIVGDILSDIEEEENAQTENALKKYHRELGAKLFFYAYVKFDADRRKLRESGDDWENAGALLMSRLKLIKAAKDVVEAKK